MNVAISSGDWFFNFTKKKTLPTTFSVVVEYSSEFVQVGY